MLEAYCAEDRDAERAAARLRSEHPWAQGRQPLARGVQAVVSDQLEYGSVEDASGPGPHHRWASIHSSGSSNAQRCPCRPRPPKLRHVGCTQPHGGEWQSRLSDAARASSLLPFSPYRRRAGVGAWVCSCCSTAAALCAPARPLQALTSSPSWLRTGHSSQGSLPLMLSPRASPDTWASRLELFLEN